MKARQKGKKSHIMMKKWARFLLCTRILFGCFFVAIHLSQCDTLCVSFVCLFVNKRDSIFFHCKIWKVVIAGEGEDPFYNFKAMLKFVYICGFARIILRWMRMPARVYVILYDGYTITMDKWNKEHCYFPR